MLIDFTNKTIIVTGGTSGIGKEIAIKFAELGGNLIITGTSSSKPKDIPISISYYQLDLLDDSSLDNFIEQLGHLPQIDILINNAGINEINELDMINVNDHDEVIKVNLNGPFIISKKLVNKMKSSGGKIVNIGSIWSAISKKGRLSYITSKAALAGLTRGLSTDLAEDNILVNTVSPGFTLTDLTKRSLSKEEIIKITDTIPMKRMAETSEIANVVIFLASDLNTYLTGQNIFVDGGFINV